MKKVKTRMFEFPDVNPAEKVDVLDYEGSLERAREQAGKKARKTRRIGRLRELAYYSVDIAELYLPKAAQPITRRLKEALMPKRVKPYLKQLSTWEGIAAVLGAVGITIYPEAMVGIVTGVFLIIGSLEMWKSESEED